MADLIETLHKKGDASTRVFPNIISDNIPNGAITTYKITDNAVTTNKIVDGAVTTNKIVDNAITTSKILDANITTAKLDDGAVTTIKIANNSITNNKIVSNSISNDKIQDDAISTAKIQDGSITASKLADGIIAKTYKHIYVITIATTRYMITIINNDSESYISSLGAIDDKLYKIINEYIFKADEFLFTQSLSITPTFTLELYDLDNNQVASGNLEIISNDVYFNSNNIYDITSYVHSANYTIDTTDFITIEL